MATRQSEDPAPRGGGEEQKARHDNKVQIQGRAIVSTLYMLIRNVKIHSPENEIFLKPIESLRETVNNVIATDKAVNLQAAGTSIYLNNAMLKFDFQALENVTYLTKEFESRDIGGFSTRRPVTTQEIRDFLYLFSANFQGKAKEDGADGKELPSLKLARYQQVKDIIDKLQAEPDLNQQIDRKKYLMTVYARAVFFMRMYFERMMSGKGMLPFAKAARLVQDLVELCHEQRSHFLGLTTSRADGDYLAFHSVNCALLSVVFGSELGLDRRQLHELGMAALFSQLGTLDIPEAVLSRRGGLSKAERAMVDLSPLKTAKKILQTRGFDKTTMGRIVAAYEAKVDYAIPQKDEAGEIQLVMPKVNLGIYGKVISIVDCYDALTSKRPFREAYGPEIALALMTSDMKYKFDPVLLRIFMKVMAIQPIKILGKGQSTLRIG
jgi:HD-GYP domain-containing protein (c-di-GMP phosphodiesterase class II)